jgi:hypothetical protein
MLGSRQDRISPDFGYTIQDALDEGALEVITVWLCCLQIEYPAFVGHCCSSAFPFASAQVNRIEPAANILNSSRNTEIFSVFLLVFNRFCADRSFLRHMVHVIIRVQYSTVSNVRIILRGTVM